MRAVIVSVSYGDMLTVTLPAWKALLPPGTLSVATSPDDAESQDIAKQHGVPSLITDAWTRFDDSCHRGGVPTFNAALGMDVTLGLAEDLVARPNAGDLIVNINADCYPFGTWPSGKHVKPGVLYGAWRHHCLTPGDLAKYQQGRLPLKYFPRMKNSGGRPVGYFNVWRYVEGRRFGSYPTAGKYDTHFITRCYENKWAYLNGLHLFHLGPQADWANWAGRVVPRWGAA